MCGLAICPNIDRARGELRHDQVVRDLSQRRVHPEGNRHQQKAAKDEQEREPFEPPESFERCEACVSCEPRELCGLFEPCESAVTRHPSCDTPGFAPSR